MNNLEEPIHWHKCKNKNKNLNPQVVQNNYGLFKISAHC